MKEVARAAAFAVRVADLRTATTTPHIIIIEVATEVVRTTEALVRDTALRRHRDGGVTKDAIASLPNPCR